MEIQEYLKNTLDRADYDFEFTLIPMSITP